MAQLGKKGFMHKKSREKIVHKEAWEKILTLINPFPPPPPTPPASYSPERLPPILPK